MGKASLAYNDETSTSSPCDSKTKYPRPIPWLERLALPLSATLATFFGAAIGLARSRVRLKVRISAVFRWAALIGTADDWLAVLQTFAGFVYLASVTIAFGYLFFDSQNQPGVTDSPFTHTFIKS